MRNLLSIIAVAFVASYTSASLAADMASKAAPPALPWSLPPGAGAGSIWVAISAGYGNAILAAQRLRALRPVRASFNRIHFPANSPIGGVHVGFNWQWDPLVVGEEADWDWTNGHNTFCRGTDGAAPNSPVCADTTGNGFLAFTSKTEMARITPGAFGFRVGSYPGLRHRRLRLSGRVDSTLQANCPAACGILECRSSLLDGEFLQHTFWLGGRCRN